MKKKNIGKLLKIGAKFVKDCGPQIMAAAGTACFIASIIFAVEEAPKAKKVLEEKMEADEEMTKPEQIACMASNMKKTLIAGTAGTALTAASWVGVLGKLTVVGGSAVAAKQELGDYIQASKEVVGEDKTANIISRKESLSERRPQKGEYSEARYDTVHPFVFPTGDVVWMTWNEYDQRQEQAVIEFVENRLLSMNKYMEIMGARRRFQLGLGWEIPDCGMPVDRLMIWARDTLKQRETKFTYSSGVEGYSMEFVESDEIIYDPQLF